MQRKRKTAMGSLNYETGQITVSFYEKGNYKSFKKHLKKVLYLPEPCAAHPCVGQCTLPPRQTAKEMAVRASET